MKEVSRLHYFIGWDVGGWNCDNNANSRDAIVILNTSLQLVGQPWRGNLREVINQSTSSIDFIHSLFKLCQFEQTLQPHDEVMLAIDIPLAFSDSFINLLINKQSVNPIGSSNQNPYLYRYTERYLFNKGLKPLSSVKDMIGSQTTKGMHVLAKFIPEITACGVWCDGNRIKAIEAYPSPCKKSKEVQALLNSFFQKHYNLTLEKWQSSKKETNLPWNNQDKYDALVCAMLGWLYINQTNKILQPVDEAPIKEGWIFIPLDTIAN